MKEALNSPYPHSKQCVEEVHFIPGQGYIQCATEDGRKNIMDLTGPVMTSNTMLARRRPMDTRS